MSIRAQSTLHYFRSNYVGRTVGGIEMRILMDDCISDVDCSIDQPNIDRMFSRSDISLARPHAGGSEHYQAILLLASLTLTPWAK